MKYQFTVFADYFQFYLEDENNRRPAKIDWNPQTLAALVVTGTGFIAVGTIRNMNVSVIIELYERQPDSGFDKEMLESADQVVECSLEVSSERLVIMGTTDYDPDAPRIPISPSIYRVRIYYGGFDTLSEDGLEGDDSYTIILYPGQHTAPTILKRGHNPNF